MYLTFFENFHKAAYKGLPLPLKMHYKIIKSGIGI